MISIPQVRPVRMQRVQLMLNQLKAHSSSLLSHTVAPVPVSGQSGWSRPRKASSTAPVSQRCAATGSMTVSIEGIHALRDNFVWLVHDTVTNKTAVIDPSEAAPVVAALNSKGWSADVIWNTHHHGDHTGGNLDLKRQYPGLTVVGPRADKDRIPGIDIAVGDGDVVTFGDHKLQVFDTPGHTRGHITFWMPSASALFPGDTLFLMGCGRTFEGTHEQMWESLSKLSPLPDDAKVYCAHEYTQSNARFAVAVDPDNQILRARKQQVDDMRSANIDTVPGNLGEERATNPFLRASDPSIRKHLGIDSSAPDWQVFSALRAKKDSF